MSPHSVPPVAADRADHLLHLVTERGLSDPSSVRSTAENEVGVPCLLQSKVIVPGVAFFSGLQCVPWREAFRKVRRTTSSSTLGLMRRSCLFDPSDGMCAARQVKLTLPRL